MSDTDEHGRTEPPMAGDEVATLTGFLDYQRQTFEWKTRGLDAAGLRVRVAASQMTLAGMLKHLTLVEADWFQRWLSDIDLGEPWRSVDWEADRDWDWHSAVEDDPDRLRALWQAEVANSRSIVAAALRNGGLAQLARRPFPDGQSVSLRWILVHMIEEYARHNGHADLIRESIDGSVGE